MHRTFFLLLCLVCFLATDALAAEESSLFHTLSLVEEIDKEAKDKLPFFYNYSMMGGYFNMPSGRMPAEGVVGLGAARVHPYNLYGLSFQYFDRVELSLNYRVYTGILDANFGKDGFGDEAERIGNIKFAFNLPSDGFPHFPTFVIGADDFLGSKRFNAEYMLMTKEWRRANLEATLGWGRKRIKGFFGGAAWTPFRQLDLPLLSNLSLLAEYDAIDYQNHPHEHPQGREVKSRINWGAAYVWKDMLQLTLNSLRGKYLAGSASLRYPLGTSSGFFKKTDNPLLYASPVDTEPLGVVRPSKLFAQELAYTLGSQGLDLYEVYLSKDGKQLWIKIINNSYREESVVRERVERVLAALTPSDIETVFVVIEADSLNCQGYKFRTEDLFRYRQGLVGDFELKTVAPLREAPPCPPSAEKLFKRTKQVWSFTFRPRVITFFGSAYGKFKYNVGLIAVPEGYLFNQVYYKAQVAYEVKSSMYNLEASDRLNPSELPQVRTDTIKYFQTGTFSLEMAYLQKGWNLSKGWFYRLAGGYFEPAYGGIATEFLYYPVDSNWAFGVEEATVMKRRYDGLGFTRFIRELKGDTLTHQKFIGVQAFASLYYMLKPWNVDLKVMAGQFLAKDVGARFQISKWFDSGLNVTLWYTITNGHDKLNGTTYYDKGFAFELPLDFFLRKSSRSYMGYAMSAWLRDVGASCATGKPLFVTLSLERQAP